MFIHVGLLRLHAVDILFLWHQQTWKCMKKQWCVA